MNTGEYKCIRYLMKEMDPSEELEFEQLMREDENLLIEVESLRVTNRKIDQIPLKNPPKSLTKKIANEVNQLQSERIKKSNHIYHMLKTGIAATILVGALSGGYYYLSGVSEINTSTPASAEDVTPWVDRNEVLRYTNTSQSVNSPALDTEVLKSYEKLQLVRSSSGDKNNLGIHLTGSSN
ncbi:MAG: hypothetical protein WD059_00785 [Balneolaceae bacterium]